jgi:hypothetical protein
VPVPELPEVPELLEVPELPDVPELLEPAELGAVVLGLAKELGVAVESLPQAERNRLKKTAAANAPRPACK